MPPINIKKLYVASLVDAQRANKGNFNVDFAGWKIVGPLKHASLVTRTAGIITLTRKRIRSVLPALTLLILIQTNMPRWNA
jgi:hypothetical protein